MEPVPRTWMVALVPGWPLELNVCTPAILPLSALVTLLTCAFSSWSAATTPAEPVYSERFTVPYDTTMSSSSEVVEGWSLTWSAPEPTSTVCAVYPT